MPSNLTRSIRVLPCVLGLSVLVSACGGNDDTVAAATPAPPPPPAVGSATGVLTDAAVQGVAYTTSSGVAGTTDALGHFTYNPNDTVSFKLGALTLGAVPASALVTPVQLSAGSNDKLTNLLVLLQSLDDDGNASNGIRIPVAAAAAVTAGVDLAQQPAAFASTANTGLTAAMAAGGISRAVTSTTQATAHFVDQAKLLLSSQVWVGQYDGGAGIFVQRFSATGEQLTAQIGAAADGGSSGLEFGTTTAIAVDGRGFRLDSSITIDTNGNWGAAERSSCERVTVVGDQLRYVGDPVTCPGDTTTTLTKAENDPNGIVGVWALGSATVAKTQTFVFWANGKYAMIDPVGDTNPSACGGPGVEYGSYTYNATTKEFKVTGVTVDTNGCAGLSDIGQTGLATFTLTLAAGGATATAAFGDSLDTVFRISK